MGFETSRARGDQDHDGAASDEALMAACRQGDARAWEQLIGRYRRMIYSVPFSGFKMTTPDADEIFQRVVVKLFEHLPRLKDARRLSSWLMTVARNECRNLYARARRWHLVEELDPDTLSADPPDVVEDLHEIACEHVLIRAFECLDESSRALLSALFLEEPRPPYAEIARRLDCPVGSLGPTRARSLEKLRTLYLELGGPEPNFVGVDLIAGLRKAS